MSLTAFDAARARQSARRTIAAFVLPVLLGVCVAPIDALAAGLTLADAQRHALSRSRQIAAQQYAVSASRDMATAAGQLPDPVLKAGIDNLPVSGSDRFSVTNDFMTMRRIGVMQELTRADKRHWRAERFHREADKSLAEKNVAVAAIERDTALAWLDRYYAQAMASVVAEQGEQAKLEIQAAEGAYRAGRGTQAEVFAARSALAAFDDRASEIARRVRTATTVLARWVGDAASQPLAGEAVIDRIRLDTAALETQLAHHPQLAVLAIQEQVAQAEAQLAQANRKSDWSVEVAYQQRGPAYSNMVSVGVSVPLQWDQRNRQDREVAAKLAMVEQARAQREETLRQHVAEVRAMVDEWQNNLERHGRYERELIPLAKERTTAALAAYRGGKATLADVLAARRNDIDVRLQALQLQADAARLWAQLNYLFPESVQSDHSSSSMGELK